MNGREEHRRKIELNTKYKASMHSHYVGEYYLSLADVEYKTKQVYVDNVIRMLDSIGKDPKHIRMIDLTEYFESCCYIKQGKRTGEPTSGSYRVAIHHAVKRFFRFLKSSGYIEKNFMEEIPQPKAKPANQVHRMDVTKEVLDSFLERAKTGVLANGEENKMSEEYILRDYTIVCLFLNTGMRCSALSQINIDDYDVENGTISVIDKGDEKRTYVLNKKMQSLLNEWLLVRSEKLTCWSDALFISSHKKRMDQTTIIKTIKKFSPTIDGKTITPHKLRAIYGQTLYEKVHDIYFVQSCMGHKNVHTTEIYVQPDKKNMEKAADIMSDIL